jgi:hypothetical protein
MGVETAMYAVPGAGGGAFLVTAAGHGSATSGAKAGSQDQVSVLLHANPLYGGSTPDNNAAVYASVVDDGNGGTEATRNATSGQESGIVAGSYAALDKTTVTARYRDSMETDGAFC